MTPLRLALIGCGGMAHYHVRSYAELAAKAPGRFEIVAACDIDTERAGALAAQVAQFQDGRAPAVFDDYRPMLDEVQPDAADLVLPHFRHHSIARDCLEAGAHVLVEKPLALTMRAGRLMLDAAHRSGKLLAVAEQERRSVASRTLHWAIHRARLIGEPRMIFAQNVRYSLGVTVGTPWRHDKLVAGGGWVLDGEVHAMDLLRYLFGDVDEVYARLGSHEPTRYFDHQHLRDPVPSNVEDAATAILTFACGVVATFSWTSAAPGRGFSHRRYFGSEGSLDTDALVRKDGRETPFAELREQFLRSLAVDERERLFPAGITDAITIELYDFLEAVRTGRRPEIDGKEGLRDMAVCEALYESDAVRQAVKVADVLDGSVDAYQRLIDAHWGLLPRQ
jgi:predicted dehydrogenase